MSATVSSGLDRRTLMGLTAAALAVSASARAQAERPPEIIRLWPDRPPGAPAQVPQERIEERTEDGVVYKVAVGIGEPNLTIVRPPNPNGAILLVIPGGGYVEEWFEKEGLEIAHRFAPAGITSFILRYRLPQEGWAQPTAVALQDAQRALRLIRARAPTMGLDPARVCAMGFSAGGHLTADLSTRSEAAYSAVDAADKGSTRPDLAVLVYPAIDMELSMRDVWRPVALLGSEPGQEAVSVHTPSRFVNRATPPTFLVHAVDDQLVSVQHSLTYAAALQAQKVPFELHIFEEGRHGFALRRPAEVPVAAWPDLFLRWAARHRFVSSA
jgi:acetyl esterase/lipase